MTKCLSLLISKVAGLNSDSWINLWWHVCPLKVDILNLVSENIAKVGYVQVHDSCAAKSATVQNDVDIFADEMFLLEIAQVIKHFAKSKQRSDTGWFYTTQSNSLSVVQIASTDSAGR